MHVEDYLPSFLFSFLGPKVRHMEAPRLGVESELQPPAYATATAMSDPSLVCNLHHSSWQRRILDPLSEARDQTRNLMVSSRIRFHCTTTRTPVYCLFLVKEFIKKSVRTQPRIDLQGDPAE